ncbi:MAG: substrate-binding domain-containing protein [Nibricoccus sp.]
MKKLLLALLALPVVAFAQNITVAVIPKGTSNFWKTYEAGAKKAAAELGVEVVVRGTKFESDVDAQVHIVDYFREKKVSAIVITPLHKDTLVEPLEKVIADGIPVIVTDSALNSTKISAFIASNNLLAGQMGASALVKALGGNLNGEVALLRYLKGSESTEKREAAALQELKTAMPKATIVDGYYSGSILGDVKRTCDTMLDEHPNLKGVVAISTISTKGLLKSVEQRGLGGKIVLIGAGSDDEVLPALRNGEIKALVLQNPFEMGYRGVKTAVAVVKGEKVEKQAYTDLVMVTTENVDKPEIQRLINP